MEKRLFLKLSQLLLSPVIESCLSVLFWVLSFWNYFVWQSLLLRSGIILFDKDVEDMSLWMKHDNDNKHLVYEFILNSSTIDELGEWCLKRRVGPRIKPSRTCRVS